MSKTARDLMLGVFLVIVATVLAVIFGFHAAFHAWMRAAGIPEAEELMVSGMVLSFVCAWFALRRRQELGAEIAGRKQTEEALIRAQNELEYRVAERTADLQRLNAHLRAQETQMRTMTETLGAALFIFQGTQMCYVNPAAEALSGYRRHELLAMPFWEVVHPAYRDLVRQRGLARQRGESVPVRYELKIVTKDSAERWVDFTGGQITFEGRPAVLGTAFDVTERKQAEEALRQSEDRFRRLVELSPDAVVVHHAGTIVFVNTAGATLVGASDPSQLLGRRVLDFVHPDYHDLAEARIRQIQESGYADRVEEKLVRLDGRMIDVEVAGTLTTYQHQSAIQLVVRDITERKCLEDQLRQSQKMEAIGTLAGGIAHDFNNILAVIMGYTELASQHIPQASPAWRNLQEVLTASSRAKGLVQQILAFSRPRDHARQPVSLRRVVEETLPLLRASLPSTIDIQAHIAPDIGTVLADPTQMHQVLMNLCANAEHAMRLSGGVLEVRLEAVDLDATCISQYPALRPGPHVRITVRDTGHGIAPGTLERIFEPFFTTKGVGEGSGMGLAVVHGIVTSHGGAITVQSTPGEGTTFAIYLPRISETAATSTSQEAPLTPGKGRILFVDDEVALARMHQGILERLGYDVVSCTSGVQALETFRSMPSRFDLVITDQTMPTMTGEQLARELRRIRPDIPIILCTGFSHVINAEKAQAAGIDAFLMKPLGIRDLVAAIQRVLAQCTT